MTLKTRVVQAIKDHFLSPLLVKLDEWESIVNAYPDAIRGIETSPIRFHIPREGLKLPNEEPPLPGFPRSFPQLLGSLSNIRKSVLDLDRNPSPGRRQIDADTLTELENFAHTTGADVIGYTSVPQEWIFRDTAIAFDQAIVLVMEMSKKRMDLAPNPDTAVMVHETYNALGQVSNRVADWLRSHGYGAHAGHPLMGMALYPPMAQAAGLGWRGISGLLITPQYGPRVRLTAVFTNIENLPLNNNEEHAWILDFCESCRRCIRECPPDAFYNTPIHHENGLVTVIDNRKCFPYFATHHGCSICIKVCPFNQQGYESIKASFMGIRPMPA
jgi:epoxyqueuosine reductase